MNDEQEVRCREALSTYCEWLTKWSKLDDASYTIEVEKDFYGPYGYREVVADYSGGYYRTMHFEVGYGDDGGNSELICMYHMELDEPMGEYADNLVYMVQIFDTMAQAIWDLTNHNADREPVGFMNTPDDKGY